MFLLGWLLIGAGTLLVVTSPKTEKKEAKPIPEIPTPEKLLAQAGEKIEAVLGQNQPPRTPEAPAPPDPSTPKA